MDLALNNLQRLKCHKIQTTKPNQNKPNQTYNYFGWLVVLFCGISTLLGLFHAEVSLTPMISNDIWPKILSIIFNKSPLYT